MKTITTNLIVLLMPALFLFVGCSNPTDSAPTSGIISGSVTFTGTWPATGTVSISLNTDWPPAGAPYAFKTIESIDLDLDDKYSYSFENVTFGTYPAITISWQDPGDSNPATNQHALGAYGGEFPFFTAYGGTDPSTITVSETDYSKTDLNFSANLIYATSSTGGQ